MNLDGFDDVTEIMRCGVYALVSKGKVIYVGKSKGMLARVYTHRQNWIARRRGRGIPDWLTPVKGILFDEIHVCPCSLDRLDSVEREMIDRYKPKYNEQLKTQEKITAPINIVVGGVALTLNETINNRQMVRRF